MATEFFAPDSVSSFRRIAAGMWRNPDDPTIYGAMDVDATQTLRFIADFRARTGLRLTVTHVVAHAVARAFARHPELNAKVRFWGKLEQRRSVDLFVSVSTDEGRDLSGARIDRADTLDLGQLVTALEGRARAIRSEADPSYAQSRRMFRAMPWWLARPATRLSDLLTNELHLDLPAQGLPRDPFGTAVITNVGPFGIETAFAPFIPLARCPMLLLVTEVRELPVALPGGRIVARPTLRLCGTFDHRVIDGVSAGRLARAIRAGVEQPDALATAAGTAASSRPVDAAPPAH